MLNIALASLGALVCDEYSTPLPWKHLGPAGYATEALSIASAGAAEAALIDVGARHARAFGLGGAALAVVAWRARLLHLELCAAVARVLVLVAVADAVSVVVKSAVEVGT